MVDKKPLVSIGMPVYNGSNFLHHAMESLLAQNYENFELIISDNHSTDSTQEICLDYVVRDKRIQYFRNEMNVGAIKNFNKVFEISQGEYFMWHAHDDLREPNYISLCLKFMEENPNVVLCCTDALLEQNANVNKLGQNVTTIGMSPNKRFRKILWMNSCASIYGLIRSRILRKTGLLRSVFGADNLLLAELSLMGEFFQMPLVLFRKNIADGNIVKKVEAVFETIFPHDNRAYYFPFTKLAMEHWKLIQNSELVGRERLIGFWNVILCFLVKYKIILLDPAATVYLNFSKFGNKENKCKKNLTS